MVYGLKIDDVYRPHGNSSGPTLTRGGVRTIPAYNPKPKQPSRVFSGISPLASAAPTPAPSPAPAPAPMMMGASSAPAAAPVPPTPPPMSLDDFIKSNFLYTAEQNEGARRLDDFDAQTQQMTQETQADQELRRNMLRRQLDDMGQSNAENMAGRGLLRSGMTFENQDDINEQGVDAEAAIQQLLTDLVSGRGQGRINQQAQNRSALNDRISQLTDQFNQKQLQHTV